MVPREGRLLSPEPHEGFALARESEHDDARFLVSLFPHGAPATRAEAAAVFLARCDDVRCLCWADLMAATGSVEQ